jgi:hypothetical protein
MRDVSILGARRSYEFAPEQIQLDLLSNAFALEHLKQAFGFDYGAIVQPSETFGPVPSSVPPGLAFYYGVVQFPEAALTPVRFVHIEPERLVLEVAGDSQVLDEVMRVLMERIDMIENVSGTPILGEEVRIQEQSEIRFRGSFAPSALAPPVVQDSISAVLSRYVKSNLSLAPALTIRPVDFARPYGPESHHPSKSFVLELESGFPPEERIYNSVAPLNTVDHLALLHQIDAALSS